MTMVMVIVGLPILLLPYQVAQKYEHLLVWNYGLLLKHIMGINHQILGERPDHPVIYAANTNQHGRQLFFTLSLTALHLF